MLGSSGKRSRTGRAPTSLLGAAISDSCRLVTLSALTAADNCVESADFSDPVHATSAELLRFNVGGQPYILREGTIIQRAPQSLLATFVCSEHRKRVESCNGYLEQTQEYFFERSPAIFACIYRYYSSGYLYKPSDVCEEEFLAELLFWKLTHAVTVDQLFGRSSIGVNGDARRKRSLVAAEEQAFEKVRWGVLRRTLWDVAEEPGSSNAAQAFAFFSVLFVLISIAGLVVGSIPEFQVEAKSRRNDTVTGRMEPHPVFAYVEDVCMVWFTGEYLLKIAVATQRFKFFVRFLNLIDFLAIVPYYLELSLYISGIDTEDLRDLKAAFLVIRILRVARVIRIFKLGRYSTGLQTFALTLQKSVKQLGMMSMVLCTGIIFFSTLVYFFEKEEPTSQFYSIPAGFWWCIVTMTTVGYGDVVPVSLGGKLVASGAITCGVLVLALPITVIVDNFMKVSGSDSEHSFGQLGGGEQHVDEKLSLRCDEQLIRKNDPNEQHV